MQCLAFAQQRFTPSKKNYLNNSCTLLDFNQIHWIILVFPPGFWNHWETGKRTRQMTLGKLVCWGCSWKESLRCHLCWSGECLPVFLLQGTPGRSPADLVPPAYRLLAPKGCVCVCWGGGALRTMRAQFLIPNLLNKNQVTFLWEWIREQWEAEVWGCGVLSKGKETTWLAEKHSPSSLPPLWPQGVSLWCCNSLWALVFLVWYIWDDWCLLYVMVSPLCWCPEINMLHVDLLWQHQSHYEQLYPLPNFSLRATHACTSWKDYRKFDIFTNKYHKNILWSYEDKLVNTQ